MACVPDPDGMLRDLLVGAIDQGVTTSQRIYSIILRVLRSPDHAAEVTQEVYVEVWRQSARYASDNWEVLREWAAAGLGVALKSTWDVRKQLEDGSLVPLLPGYDFGTDVGIYAVYPHRRYLPAKTRVFIDFLAESFGPEPYWDKA